MNNYLAQILPSTILIILFFLISLAIFKYLQISFQSNNDQVLRRIITVETFNNKNCVNCNECIG
jgi:hypothetical protein